MVRLWDVRSPRELGKPLTGHVGIGLQRGVQPRTATLASGGDDTTIRLVDARTQRRAAARAHRPGLRRGVRPSR